MFENNKYQHANSFVGYIVKFRLVFDTPLITLNSLIITIHGLNDNSIIFLDICYMGCFADNQTRDLPNAMLHSDSLTLDKCLCHCQNHSYSYAGLQAT